MNVTQPTARPASPKELLNAKKAREELFEAKKASEQEAVEFANRRFMERKKGGKTFGKKLTGFLQPMLNQAA